MALKRTCGRQRGSITLLALCLTAAMAIALGSYLALCHRSQQFGVRQIQNDKVRELAQVGLEEALWALNQNNWAASGPSGNGLWDTMQDGGATRTIDFSYPMTGQGMSGYVELKITNYTILPTTIPYVSEIWPTIVSKATITLASGEVFTKTLQASTTPAPLFGNAIASAESNVSFQGGRVDSWHSNPSHISTFSRMPDSYAPGTAVANYNAVVAGRTDTNGTYGVSLMNAEVRGYVSTFGLPIATSGSTAAKVLGPSTASGVNVDPLRVGKSAFVPVSPVFTVTTPTVPPTGTISSSKGLIDALLDTVEAVLRLNTDLHLDDLLGAIADFLLGGSEDPTVEINRPVKLVVGGDFKLIENARVLITPTGSLELFVSGNIVITSPRGFVNQTNDPKKLAIYSTSTANTAIIYNSTASFCGVIYSENKPIEIRRNGPFYGAILSRKSVQFLGQYATNPQFHYDVALRKTVFPSVKTPYLISQVTEP